MSSSDGTLIAKRPQVYCVGSSTFAEDIAGRLDIEDAVQFAAETHKRDPEELRAMCIVVEDSALVNRGLTLTTPLKYDGEIRYPFIRLPVRRTSPLNHNLRHELRHPFQSTAVDMYRQPRAMATLQRASRVAAAAEACGLILSHGIHASLTPEEIIGIVAGSTTVGTASIAAAVNPAYLAWYFSRKEWDANIFAARTSAFKPIRGRG
jgi:hypothetical protein